MELSWLGFQISDLRSNKIDEKNYSATSHELSQCNRCLKALTVNYLLPNILYFNKVNSNQTIKQYWVYTEILNDVLIDEVNVFVKKNYNIQHNNILGQNKNLKII